MLDRWFNDVTTDVQKPPEFRKAKIGDLPENFKKLILETFPDLKPKRYPYKDRSTVFNAMLAAAADMPRWHLTVEDAKNGVLEGYATTAVWRFKDDFVFECRQDSAGNTIVQGRSKSRVGFTDLGMNAKRIQQYLAKVDAHLN